MRINILLAILLMALVPMLGHSQNKAKQKYTVSGIVTDNLGDPLPGTTIYVKNAPGVGTSSDIDGKYSIKVDANQILVFQAIGMESVEKLIIKNEHNLKIVLKEDNTKLEEVVVTGMTSQKKVSVVGAISTIDVAQLSTPGTSLNNMIGGRLPGVITMQTSGEPGQNISNFWIRGISTFGANSGALVLIDGIEGKLEDIFSHDLITYNNQFIYRVNEQEQINLHDHNLKAWVYGHWHINYMKKWGNVFAVSTAVPNKGGIDHSTNVFRVMYVDKHGNFKSELRYTYLNKKIQIASPMEGQVSFFASESIPLVVNVYSSESPVNEVTYTCLVDGKTIYTDKKLRQATDWCWNADVPLTVEQQKKKVTLKLKARFSNGETVESERTFICQSVMREVTLTGNWENLLGNPQHAVKDQMALKPPLQLAWTKNIGANIYMASPLVYDGKIYVASVDENLKGEAYVYSLDGKTGEFVWKYQVRNSIKNTIAAGDGQVLVQDAQGYLYAIDAKSGQLSWEMQLSINVLPSLVEGLVVSNDIVYAGTGEGLCAINIKNGKVIWRNVNWRQNMGATATLSVGKNVLIGSSQWGALYANDLVTGRLKWKASADGLRNRAASAAIHGDLLYIISNNSLFIMKTDNGKVIARKELPFVVDVTSTPLLTDNEIIFGSTRNGLIALDSQTFDVKWKFNTNSALVLSSPYSGKHSATIETSPILAGNTVYVGASDGMIYGVNKGNGQLVWKYETGAPIFSSVAISGNALIATDFGGNVYTFVTQE